MIFTPAAINCSNPVSIAAQNELMICGTYSINKGIELISPCANEVIILIPTVINCGNAEIKPRAN